MGNAYQSHECIFSSLSLPSLLSNETDIVADLFFSNAGPFPCLQATAEERGSFCFSFRKAYMYMQHTLITSIREKERKTDKATLQFH